MKKITLSAPAKATKNCFVGSNWLHRDSDFDSWLPKTQPAQQGEITVITRDKEQTFLEMAQEYLGTTDPEKIKPYCLTLPMVEKMIEERREELCTEGWANFFFVETGKEEEPVSVAHVRRDAPGWSADVGRFGDDGRWHAGPRLLVRNLDASKLGNSGPSDTQSLELRLQALEEWRERVQKP